jgi:proline iminopeptidase
MRIAVNGTELYVDVEGSALVPDGPGMRERPVIVALHGGPGFDHAYFKPALSAFAEVAQVVYLDLRGQGRSGRPPVETCTLEAMADDVAAVCCALGFDAPVILGHSAGGFVALHLAVCHPGLAGGLVLVNTAAATADMDGAMTRLEGLRGPEARAAGERMFGGDFSPEAMAAFGRLVLPAYVHDPNTAEPIFAALARSTFAAEVAAFFFQQRAPHYDLRARLPDIVTPALVIAGASDWLCPPRAAEVIAAGMPRAELQIIPSAGHFSFAEQPACFAAAVRRFLMVEPAASPALESA